MRAVHADDLLLILSVVTHKAEEFPGVTTDWKSGKGYPLPINSIILDGNVTFWTVT